MQEPSRLQSLSAQEFGRSIAREPVFSDHETDRMTRAKTVCWQLQFCGERNGLSRQLEVTRTLPIGEMVHRALVALAGRGQVIDCPELIGQDRIGQPLSGRHGHAKILPVDLDGDGIIDHVILHAPMGLGSVAQRAIDSLRVLHFGPACGVQLQVVATDRPNGPLVPCLFPQFQGATSWTSLTPFVPPRFLKKSGKNSLPGQVNAELAARGLPEAVTCEVVPQDSAAMRRFIRKRQEGKLAPPQDLGLALRLDFARPILGPVALGYASHFGLGWFATE